MADPHGMLDKAEQSLALKMARTSLRIALTEERLADERELQVPETGIFREKRACFVTLHRLKNLRGCIGHILPVEELWKSIRSNAVSAALNDHRFRPVAASELSSIDLDISVLTLPRDIRDYTHFKAGPHGILMELRGRRAVFLPQVAPEQGWDEAATLTHLSMKAGLAPDAWRDPAARFQIFEAQVFSEEH